MRCKGANKSVHPSVGLGGWRMDAFPSRKEEMECAAK